MSWQLILLCSKWRQTFKLVSSLIPRNVYSTASRDELSYYRFRRLPAVARSLKNKYRTRSIQNIQTSLTFKGQEFKKFHLNKNFKRFLKVWEGKNRKYLAVAYKWVKKITKVDTLYTLHSLNNKRGVSLIFQILPPSSTFINLFQNSPLALLLDFI